MKILLCAFAFSACLFFWQTKSFRLARRTESLCRIRDFLLNISDGIRSSRKNIFDIIASDKTELGLFKGVSANGQLLYTYYLRAKQSNMAAFCLEPSDEALLDGFFRDFGAGDTESQLRLCAEAVARSELLLRDAEDKRNRYCRLYTAVGLCTGSLCVIILL